MRTTGPDVERGESVSVPTAGQVLARTVPAAAVLAAGLPVLTQWALDGSSNTDVAWLPFAPAMLMVVALIVQHLVQAPRPRLDPHADQKALRRWLVFTSASGRVPEDPQTRTAVGVLACGPLETAALAVGGIAGIIAIWIVRDQTWWAVTVILVALIAVVPMLRARRSWRYLRALHAPAHTG